MMIDQIIITYFYNVFETNPSYHFRIFKLLSREQTANYDYVNKTGKNLVSSATTPTHAEKLKQDLDHLTKSWNEVIALAEERKGRVEKAIGELGPWQVCGKHDNIMFKCFHVRSF